MKVLFVNPPQTASKYKFMGVIAPHGWSTARKQC